MNARPSFFQRFVLPGFAFKAVVIGGGYATGRELVEFFFPSGPAGGLAGMLVTMLLWSIVCSLTFLFAYVTGSLDYRTFFSRLLGRGWVLFEAAYVMLILLVLSVFGAAAGEIGRSLFGLPLIAGTLLLTACIAITVSFGSQAVERVFKYVSFFLYGVYAIFVLLTLTRFHDRVAATLALDVPMDGWLQGGLTYAGYNIIGAVVILPVARHFTCRRDAVVAGLLCGPLAALPALLFFICILAFYPQIGAEALPSDFMLTQLGIPLFHVAFQLMIFAALLEGGAGLVHALNERVATVYAARGADLSERARLIIAVAVMLVAIFVATRFGLITLIAKGYGTSAYVFLALYVLPLLTIGFWRMKPEMKLAPSLGPRSQ
jgi:uncharacterized membrane protein YkvI